jgi:hypothetical protein
MAAAEHPRQPGEQEVARGDPCGHGGLGGGGLGGGFGGGGFGGGPSVENVTVNEYGDDHDDDRDDDRDDDGGDWGGGDDGN